MYSITKNITIRIIVSESMNSKKDITLPKFLQNMDVTLQNEMLEWALENNNQSLMKAILQHGKANPTIGNNKILYSAAKNGFSEILSLLLTNECVKNTVSCYVYSHIISSATVNDHIDAVEIILQHVKPEQFDDQVCFEVLRKAKKSTTCGYIIELLTDLCNEIRELQKNQGTYDELIHTTDDVLPDHDLINSEKHIELLKILQNVKISHKIENIIMDGDYARAINLLYKKVELDTHLQRKLVNWAVKYYDVDMITTMRNNRGSNPEADQFIDNIFYLHFY